MLKPELCRQKEFIYIPHAKITSLIWSRRNIRFSYQWKRFEVFTDLNRSKYLAINTRLHSSDNFEESLMKTSRVFTYSFKKSTMKWSLAKTIKILYHFSSFQKTWKRIVVFIFSVAELHWCCYCHYFAVFFASSFGQQAR